MEYANLGRTGRQVSVIGLGAWQLGADWGAVGEDDAMATLHAAVDAGVTLIDTADVYGDGRSERLIGRVLRERPQSGLTVLTKVGRRADPHVAGQYTPSNLRAWVERSRENLGLESLHLVQLHCPPTPVFVDDLVFDALDEFVAEGLIEAYGVSVETCAEALIAIARPGVASVQIIVNCFRQKPLEQVLPAARAAGVGIVARVPLASGLLSGRYEQGTNFGADDHRTYNRAGAAFDVGETFAGVPFDIGVRAAHDLAGGLPDGGTTAQWALRWILDQDGVSAAIPGARNPEQARANAAAAVLPPLDDASNDLIRRIYDDQVRAFVHDRW